MNLKSIRSGTLTATSAVSLRGAAAWVKNLLNTFNCSVPGGLSGFSLDYTHIGTQRTYGISTGLSF